MGSTPLAVVLAAGAGTRFEGEGHKLLAPFRGRALVGWAMEHAVTSGLDVVVVSGAVDLADLASESGVAHVRNDRWEQGQATSLALGVEWADERGYDAVVVGLGDQPLVPPSAWRAVADGGPQPVAVATFAGRRRPPVRLDRVVWPLLAASGDEGARELMARRPDLVCEVACDGEPADVDTREDLERWS